MGTVPISVDTYHPETAERAIALGAKIINCVYEGTVPDMLRICAKNDAELVIPAKFLGTVPMGERGTVPVERLGTVPVYIDPMIGFGTTREEDLELLRSIAEELYVDNYRTMLQRINGIVSNVNSRFKDGLVNYIYNGC